MMQQIICCIIIFAHRVEFHSSAITVIYQLPLG